jgi:adenine-specific DNA glycosylase
MCCESARCRATDVQSLIPLCDPPFPFPRCNLCRAFAAQIAWTVLYRRKHKKNIEHETSKRRVRKVARAGRAIANLTQEELMKKRNEKPDFRKVQREQAIKAAKEKVRHRSRAHASVARTHARTHTHTHTHFRSASHSCMSRLRQRHCCIATACCGTSRCTKF